MQLNPPWRRPQTPTTCLSPVGRGIGASCAACVNRRVTLGLLYFEDGTTLRAQLANWATWDPGLRSSFDFVIVDDGSSRALAAGTIVARVRTSETPPVRVLTVRPPKLAWNIGGARNLLMHHSRNCWVLLCDQDYGLSPALAGAVLQAARSAHNHQIFRFQRHFDERPLHPGIALIRKQLYWQAGGCDEDFVGHYGFTDPHLWLRLGMHRPFVDMVTNESWPRLLTMSAHERCLNEHGRECGNVTAKDSRVNSILFRRKKSGEIPWSNDYLRFKWQDELYDGVGGSSANELASLSSDIAAACPSEPIGRGCAVVMYTVIMGEQQNVQPPFAGVARGCAIMITDVASNAKRGWRLHQPSCVQVAKRGRFTSNPRVLSRWWKINSHLFFDMPTIYTDAKEVVHHAISHNFSNVHAQLLTACNATFAAFEHPMHPASLMKEYELILASPPNTTTRTPDACQRQLDALKLDGALDTSARVIEGSFVARQPSEALTALERAWWSAYTEGCDRDQPAFAHALFRLYGSTPNTCGHDVHLLSHGWTASAKQVAWSDSSAYCHPKAGSGGGFGRETPASCPHAVEDGQQITVYAHGKSHSSIVTQYRDRSEVK